LRHSIRIGCLLFPGGFELRCLQLLSAAA